MFRKPLLVSLLFFSINLVYGQSSYNYAEFDVKIDEKRFSEFISKGGFNAFEKRLYKNMLREVNRTQIAVSFNKDISVCKPIEQLGIGNTNSKLAKGGLFILLGLENEIYINKKTNSYYVKRGKQDMTHLMMSKLTPPLWKITSEEKKVNKLIYKKATSTIISGKLSYSIVAWFCPNIPNQFGPGKFHGLPGFVTEVYVNDKDYGYSFVLKKIKAKKKIDINVPIKKYKVLTEEESEKLFNKLSRSRN